MSPLRTVLAALAVLAAFGIHSLLACPFCSEQRGPTFVDDFNQASLVMLGTFTNPKIGGGGGGLDDSTTDFVIEEVVKAHESVKDKKKITLPRYVAQSKNKFLVFADVYKGNLDPYRGVELQPDTQMVKYIKGAVAVNTKPQPERLRYYFDYLNSGEIEVALDAYREFAKADYKDYKDMAKTLPASTLASWIEDPKTPPYRLGLYASLLGHCGTPEHGKLLRKMIDDPNARRGSGVDGMMAGLVMIQPKEGWATLSDLMLDAKQDFQVRYSVFRTARFLWENRPDLIEKDTLVKSMGGLIHVPDMADFAIDELRRWHRWEFTPPIMELSGKKTHELTVIRRAILRFMLQSPEAVARKFVEEQRQRDAEWVKDTEELLKLESDTK